jgi:hypothetical protein
MTLLLAGRHFIVPGGAAAPRPINLLSLRPEGGMPLVLSKRAGQEAAATSQDEPVVSGRRH